MTLPPLPRQLNKREANWTTNFFKGWLLKNPLPTGPIEVKQTTKDYLAFSAVAEHQLAALIACTTAQGFWWKVADMGARNAFDIVWYCNSAAWVVIKYPKGFVVIDARVFKAEKQKSPRKSLTWERACLLQTSVWGLP